MDFFEDNDISSPTWKKSLQDNFQEWLEGLDHPPEEIQSKTDPLPDLYSFYSELCALRSEIHRSGKRNHEAFVGFKDTLTQFENTLRTLTREQLKQVKTSHSQKNDDARQRAFRLAVVDLYERFKRIEIRLNNPPAKGLFGSAKKWRSGWNSLREAFYILRDHFQNLLSHEDIHRMRCEGRPFDPNHMKAIDFEMLDAVPPNTVTEELSSGYFYQKRVLKYAEVKVAVAKGDL